MATTDVYPLPYSERGDGFAIQAVTHWLRKVPGRRALGLLAGGLPVELPTRPAGLSHRGIEASTNGYVVASDDVSSAWLRENPRATDSYVAAVKPVLTNRLARLDGYARHLATSGDVEIFVGPRMDRIDAFLGEPEEFRGAIDLLRDAPRDGRTALASAPEEGSSRYDEPDFIFGTQSWIDGQRVLIEYASDETGRPETVALDRDRFADAMERAFNTMQDEADRLRAALAAVL
ncbi:hypothetical protein EC912_101166 [Luteibacter rhizovicinus]|uniref:Uncharacterized protein n=1 Tax=Luteibacter rhizovicinus TaxID=242606 RepID=A0A4R3YWV9_9GAMM|nr:hypothetical protein [Luteibacter rhizovicinus]TCV97171.1 hypothetical protein EC912_101166 [Luteibacter rhizovicinus]